MAKLGAPDRPHLRADAKRNRDTIVATARALFAERGLDVPMYEIAKRSGVGNGTMYRHFATRDDLVAAVFVERAADVLAVIERAASAKDPWGGFVSFIKETCAAQASDRAMADLIAIGHPSAELRALHARGYRGFSRLIERAKASGALRADFSSEDLILLYMAVAGITRFAGSEASVAAERFVALALDGFHSKAATTAPPPVSKRTMMRRLRELNQDVASPDASAESSLK